MISCSHLNDRKKSEIDYTNECSWTGIAFEVIKTLELTFSNKGVIIFSIIQILLLFIDCVLCSPLCSSLLSPSLLLNCGGCVSVACDGMFSNSSKARKQQHCTKASTSKLPAATAAHYSIYLQSGKLIILK